MNKDAISREWCRSCETYHYHRRDWIKEFTRGAYGGARLYESQILGDVHHVTTDTERVSAGNSAAQSSPTKAAAI